MANIHWVLVPVSLYVIVRDTLTDQIAGEIAHECPLTSDIVVPKATFAVSTIAQDELSDKTLATFFSTAPLIMLSP